MTIEVPGAALPAIATVASGDERRALLQQLCEMLPGMADHVAATTREVPVVIFSEAN